LDIDLNFLPDGFSSFSASILIAASFFTSGLTAAAGVGGGMLMLGLMAYLLPIAALIPVHGVVQLGSNAGRSWVQREHVDWAITRYFLVGSVFGALAGGLLAVQLPKNALEIFLGVFILVLIWIKFPPIRNASKSLVMLGGGVTTFTSMFAGATGPLVAVFLNKLFNEHRQLVATHGTTMTVQHALKILAFGVVGFAFGQWLPLVVAMIVSGYLGTKAGTLLMNKLPEKRLKQLFKITLTMVAIDLIRRGFSLF